MPQGIGKLSRLLVRKRAQAYPDGSACTATDAFRQSDLEKIGPAAPHQIEPGRSRFKLAIPFLWGKDFRVRRYIGLYIERYNARYIHDLSASDWGQSVRNLQGNPRACV